MKIRRYQCVDLMCKNIKGMIKLFKEIEVKRRVSKSQTTL